MRSISSAAASDLDDAMRLPDLRQAHARGRVRMHDAAECRTRGVRTGVDPHLAVRHAGAGDDVSIGVNDQQRVFVE